MVSFFDTLDARCKLIDSILCVGLDPHEVDVQKVAAATGLSPAKAAQNFCENIIEATSHVAAAYKPNAAFFEALGAEGVSALHRVIAHIPDNIPVLLDAKRGDISSTATAYADACFKVARANAITVHPYMGRDSISPFAKPSPAQGVFVLCKTSNPSSNDFETLRIHGSDKALYEVVAERANEWNDEFGGNIGLVVGATDVEAIARTRKASPNLTLLTPGVGFQGGNLEETIFAGLRKDGFGLLVPVSRGISRAEDPKAAAESFCDQLNQARAAKVQSFGTLMPHQITFLSLALECSVLKFGSFTLKSGRRSPYFFNAGNFDSGRALHVLGGCYAKCIVDSGIKFDVLFGPAYKGIPLGAIIASTLYADYGINVDFAYDRKEAKDHGEGGKLVGASISGRNVLIIDDVISAGTAVRKVNRSACRKQCEHRRCVRVSRQTGACD